MKLWHVYVAIGVIAFVLTGSQVLGYVDAGPIGAQKDFWKDAFGSNDAARFLAFDVLFLGLAVFVMMWFESRKVGISTRWYVAYLVLSVVIGISTFAPLFMAHRQRKLDAMAVAKPTNAGQPAT